MPGAASRSPSVSKSGAISSEHADEMQQHQHLEHVGEIVRHADDVDADGLRAVELDGPLRTRSEPSTSLVSGVKLVLGTASARQRRAP